MSVSLQELRRRAREVGLDIQPIENWPGHYRCFSHLCADSVFFADSLEELEFKLDLFETIGQQARDQFLLGVGISGDGS